MKILVIGGTGLLGKSLKKINENVICIGSVYDIFEFDKLRNKIDEINPDIIINAVSLKSEKIYENLTKTVNINIIGAANISKYCIENNKKLIYISTDYIYSGRSGNYKEDDEILPENLYAWTKLAGECSTKLVKNHIIIRTSFGDHIFPYDSAYDNLFVSKDYVDIISVKILDLIETNYVGVVNVGSERQSMYNHAIKKNVVNKTTLFKTKDFSLNLDLYNKIVKDKNVDYFYNDVCPITNKTDKLNYFNLGNIPLVNNLYDTFEESLNCEKYPLSLSIFRDSGLSALNIIVKPEKMFSNYVFRSNTNKPYYEHCKNMFKYINTYIELNENDLCVDIGGNDGTLLLAFNEASKDINKNICKKINIEPSNISNVSKNNGIETINKYFDTNINLEEKAKLIVSTNVFQHLYDIKSFVKAINNNLDDNGIWCLEFPYWGGNMETNQFDQIYHEHIYYYLVTPLYNFFKQNGLKIINISEHYIHCGSLRLLIVKDKSNYCSDNTLSYFLVKEQKYNEEYYLKWQNKIETHLLECKNFINNIHGNVVGFGAAAKGCIFLNKMNLDYNFIKYVIDDTIEKQNKYIPGTGIKIVNRDIIKNEKIDYIIILAHNFSEYIIKNLRDFGYTGKFITLLPEIKIIN